MCQCIRQTFPANIHREAKVLQEVGTKNGVFDVSDSENPLKCGRDGRVIDCLQELIALSMQTISA
jgi:hypothetical protein